MSKLEELINKLCPNGVEFKTLGDIATYRRGSFPQPYTNTSFYGGEDAMPFVQVADIKDDGFKLKDKTKQTISKIAQPKSIFVPKGTVICSIQGTIGRVAITQYDSYVDRTIAIFESLNNKIDKKFFAYCIEVKFEVEKQFARGSTLKTITKEEFTKFSIPVPPLEVQCEIVRILDNFTLLSAELSAELSARQKQYEYYRDELLTFNKKDENVKWEELGKYCQRLKGTAITARSMKEINKENGKIRIFAGGKTMINTTEHNIPSSDIIRIPNIIVQSRGIIDFIYYEKPCSFKREMWSYTHTNSVTLKFIYYYLKKNIEYFKQRGNQMGSMPQISLEVTEKFKIPLPSMNKQERIVNILDRFDKLCNDISEGLPAEIEARKKQYEYYRDKLLTFKELKDNE
ncbi:restriction endonuclease subunit S [Campylobacter lanienae]|uniref:restriction endonuclease subunit S n=1 Tax=Campylobacter lanienae TaxID=75658 RepID=UPI000BB4241D|nr:restriction endonuclease subunit S [Campylobacter lanienae]